MIKLGIIGAMSVEVETLKGQMEQIRHTCKAGMTFYEGVLEKLPVVLVTCGVGKVNAAMCVQVLCDLFGVTHIVNTGVAGSLDPELDIGDFVVSTKAVYHDFDCQCLGYCVGQVPGLSVQFFPADDLLVDLAYDAAEGVHKGHVRKGVIASGDQFVSAGMQKDKIIHETNAMCTEMEGAAIAHCSWRNQIPFVVIRAISDKADDSAQMDYPIFEAIAAKRSAQVTQLLARTLSK